MTRRQALMKLPSPYHRQAIDEVERQRSQSSPLDRGEYKGSDLFLTLTTSFSWFTSKQGYEYWSQLCITLEKHRGLSL